MDPNRNKILVTGANGFVGSRLSKVLVENYPHQVLFMAHYEMPAHKTETWFQADLLDPDSYESQLSNVKTVIHLAQLNNSFTQRSDRFFEQQLKLTENLVHSCLAFGVEELIFLSSLTTTLRTPDPNVFSDEGNQSPLLPTAFAKSKYKEELLIKKGEAEGLKVLLFYVAPLVDKQEKEGSFSGNSNRLSISEIQYDVQLLNQNIVRALSSNWWGERLLLAKERTKEFMNPNTTEEIQDSIFENLKSAFSRLLKSFFTNSKTEAAFLHSQTFSLQCQKTSILLSDVK